MAGDAPLYLADDAQVYVSAEDPPKTHGIEDGWERLLDEVDGKPADIQYGAGAPEPVTDRPDVVDDLGTYLDSEYDAADVKWMERCPNEGGSDYWNVHARHPELDDGTYLIRVRDLERDHLNTVIGF